MPFGSKDAPNVENWVRVSTLKGHSMSMCVVWDWELPMNLWLDVEDVAWSPDDRMLATCSIDNRILIWSIRADLQRITGRLKGCSDFKKHKKWNEN